MKQEDKELLLKDICARLSYGVKISVPSWDGEKQECIDSVDVLYSVNIDWYIKSTNEDYDVSIEDIKPYLFPLSSMTEEQSIELFNLFGISLVDSIETDYIKINECTGITFFLDKGFDIETHLDKLLDWLNKNHFDYRGLIEKGLAIDATNLNIY